MHLMLAKVLSSAILGIDSVQKFRQAALVGVNSFSNIRYEKTRFNICNGCHNWLLFSCGLQYQ